jgi:hypothetical protein
MNDEDIDDPETAVVDTDQPDEADEGVEPDGPGEPVAPRAHSPYRQPAFAVARAVVVLAVATVGYQAVIPTTHLVRARLAHLVLGEPGIAGYNVKPTQAAEQPAAGIPLTTVTAAAKRSPNQTGVYAIEWVKSQTDAAGQVAFLLPSAAQAAATVPQVATGQLGAASYASNGLTRRSTFTVGGVPGSMGALYTPTAKSKTPVPSLVITEFRYGRVVAMTELQSVAQTQAAATTATLNEYTHLRQVESGFTLKVTNRPVVASALWAAAAVGLAAIAAFGPIAWSRMAARRRRRIEEELANRVVVRGQVITKRRR